MNNKKSLLITIALFVVSVSVLVVVLTRDVPDYSPSIFELREVPSAYFDADQHVYPVSADMELFYTVKTVLSTINATLLIVLLATYIDMYHKLQSEFTIGLIIFSLILLIYALTSNPLVQLLFGFRAFGLGPFAMLPDLCTTLALAVLAYLTLK